MPDRRQYRLVRFAIRKSNGWDPCACSPSSRAQPVRLRRRGRSALRRPRVQIRPAIPHPVAEAVEGRSVPAHAVAVHEVQSRCRRIASRAKMRAVAALRAEEVGAMNAIDDHVSCHRYARLRSHRTGGATDPLPFRVSQDLGPLSTAGHPAARRKPARHSCQGGDGRILIHSPNVRTCAQTKRGHWMPAVSPLFVEGYEDWFRRQPYSRVRKPRTATVSAALTPHIAHEQCHRVDHPPRSHRRHVPTRTTLPIHLRRTRARGASRRSGQPPRCADVPSLITGVVL